MTIEFPGNSQQDKEKRPANNGTGVEKNIKPVSGRVVRRKKSMGSRAKELLFGGNGDGVLEYLLKDVFVPAVRDTVVHLVTEGIEKAVYGEVRTQRRPNPTGRITPSTSGRIAYEEYSRNRNAHDRHSSVRRNRSSREIDDIIMESRIQAMDVLDQLQELIDEYQSASVQDLCSILNETPDYTDNDFGWVQGDLDAAGVRRVSQGYLVVLPRPRFLK